MKVHIFRQRISQVHEGEIEINGWLEEMRDITVKFVEQSSYLTENTENGQPGYIVTVWYD